MANHESHVPPRPEAATPEATMAEFMEQHEAQMRSIVSTHEAGVAALNTNYAAQLEQATPATASRVFGDMEIGVDAQLKRTPSAVLNEIQFASSTMLGLLPDSDRQLLHGEIAEEIRSFGIDSYYVDEAIARASSPTAQRAIRTILDVQIAAHVQREIKSFGIGSGYVDDAVRKASSKAVRRAIKVTLDTQVLDYVRGEVKSFGVGSSYVDDALGKASSKTVRQAIKSSLDNQVVTHVKQEVRSFGADSGYVADALRCGSSKRARGLIAGLIITPSDKHFSTSGAYDRFQEYRRADDFIRGGFGSDAFRDTFRQKRNTKSEGDRRHQQPPHQDTPRPENGIPKTRDTEVELIVSKVTAKGYKWLETEDPRNVRRVINTVRSARQQALDSGKSLTDRDIYLRYRKQVQEIELKGGTGSTIPNSFLILSALMGGKVDGRLPF